MEQHICMWGGCKMELGLGENMPFCYPPLPAQWNSISREVQKSMGNYSSVPTASISSLSVPFQAVQPPFSSFVFFPPFSLQNTRRFVVCRIFLIWPDVWMWPKGNCGSLESCALYLQIPDLPPSLRDEWRWDNGSQRDAQVGGRERKRNCSWIRRTWCLLAKWDRAIKRSRLETQDW